MDEFTTKYDDKMQKSYQNLLREFGSIRAGRANPHVLDQIRVDYYGSPVPLQQVANVAVPDPRMILIQPWEPNMVPVIEKALLASELGLTPSIDGKAIRLAFPELTEERRKELTKEVKKKGEEAKVAVRNIRRDANESIKKQGKSDGISEDQALDLQDNIQDLTDKYMTMIDDAVDEKNKEIMTV